MQVNMVQRAVGQGGLHWGELSLGQKPIRWVYDCGSNQVDALQREIGSVAKGGEIDLLFLSHFDSDHINGVDLLLSQVKIHEVVLPYLDQETLVAIIARDAARGALTGAFVEAVSDLASWFGSRGVETVTFVQSGDEGDGDGPDVPRAPDLGGDGDCATKWTKAPKLEHGPVAALGQSLAKMQQVTRGASLLVTAAGANVNWALIPYVHKPSASLMKAFNDALDAEFGKNKDKKEIAQLAKNPSTRRKLRKCYDTLWTDHNLISMTLYTGPIDQTEMDVCIRMPRRHRYWRIYHEWPGGGGWMLTGDAHLDRLRRRQNFLKFYSRFAGLIGVLMLPHHGSVHNHSDEVLYAMPNLLMGFAAAGANRYGHPHKEVREAVCAYTHFHRVDQKLFNQIVMNVRMR